MKHSSFVLSASIAAALGILSGAARAHPQSSANALSGVDTSEPARVTARVDGSHLTTLPKSHFGFLARATASKSIPDRVQMSHLQLVLKPSAKRQAAMEAFIASQHDPKSAKFHQWLSPAQFGAAFGVQDADIAAATAWLQSQGLVVNSVYPNKTQIDFSGSAGQIKAAFHTQETRYTLGDEKHLANATDISVPTALVPIVAGVMGLNDFRPKPQHTQPQVVGWDKGKRRFLPNTAKTPGTNKGEAIETVTGVRGLVPNDMMTMYGIRTLRSNGVTGQGVTIAVVEDEDMVPSDWTNFTSVFNLQKYGGTFTQTAPPPPSGTNNCQDPDVVFNYQGDGTETLLDAEYATAMAPGANLIVASCSDYLKDSSGTYSYATDNFFGGVFIAATNLINAGSDRPDVISASYGFGEDFVDSASKTGIDLMWAQADAEGISVFVSTGDSGSNPSFNGRVINDAHGNTTLDANAFATSPHVTGVGGTDTADILDGTSSQYFAPTPSVVGGSALSYVPEIPWNASCGNGVAAKAAGFGGAVAYCQDQLIYDPNGDYITSESGSGGASSVDSKPAWQRSVYNAAKDQSRDLPDVSLFAGSYHDATFAVICTNYDPCDPSFSNVVVEGGTSLASPMFAGIQALMDQGLAARGLPMDQGNAAPTLYALAADEYGGSSAPASGIAACSADNGATGTENCVFHNITRGSNSTNCYQYQTPTYSFSTPYCYFYGGIAKYGVQFGLTTTDAAPTSYSNANKAYPAQPGWSFANGLGSVNATNLLIAWRAFDNAPAASASAHP